MPTNIAIFSVAYYKLHSWLSYPQNKCTLFFGQENILGSLVEVLVLGDPTAGLCQCALGFPSLTPGTVYLGYTNHHSLDYHQQVTFTT